MKINRILYFVYYIKNTDYRKLKKFTDYLSLKANKSKMGIIMDVIYSSFKYNISLLDYFYFGFINKDKTERANWAGTGFLYEYQLKMNPLETRNILENKIAFNNKFRSNVKRNYFTISAIHANPTIYEALLQNGLNLIVLKNSHGQAGKQVEVLDTKNISAEQLIRIMGEKKYDLAEEYIQQHSEMMLLSPTGLNTVRIITQETGGSIKILAARLRISINSRVDNMAAGNAAAPIDIQTGLVNGPAVFSDITRQDIEIHPITGVKISGFQIPFWPETINMVLKSALIIPENRSIGWDIAITNSGPILIEGNHNWCKLLWQLPVKKGLKKELEKFL